MTDRVYIDALSVSTLIGVYEFERLAPQTLLLDIDMGFDCAPAGKTDELSFALDYDQLSKRIRQWSTAQSFLLLEAYGEALCELVLAEFDISDIRLRINKPAAIEGCNGIGIHITRTR